MTVEYCSIFDLKSAGRLNIDANKYDDDMDSIVLAVSEWIDRQCRVQPGAFAVSEDSVQYYDACSVVKNRLMLDDPLISITSVVDASGYTIPPERYRLWPYNTSPKRAIELLSTQTWFNWVTDGRIVVTGKFGYSAEVPLGVQEAALIYSGHIFKRWQAALQDATANAELGQVIYSAAVPKQVLALLAQYTDYSKIL